MRVTFVLPDANLGGGTRMIAQHADNLRRRGHSVFVVSQPVGDTTLRQKVASLVRGRGWPPPPGPIASHLDGLDVEHHVLKRARPVTDRDVPDADVVVATWWETAEWVHLLSSRKGAKAYFIQHYEALLGMPEDRVAATWRLPMQKIVCARWLAELARDRFGDPGAIVARNGLDVGLFDAPERGRHPRPTVGMLYSESEAKGCDAGFAALELASRRVEGLQLRMFGWPDPPASLPVPLKSEYAKRPPQDLLSAIYADCDAWLCPSRREGYHMPPLEAMACRCPAVATRVGGPADVIEDGVNGYLVDVDDVRGLADRLVELLELPEPSWKRMSDAAYARAREFTSSDSTDAFEEALLAAVERAGGHRPHAATRAGHSG
jgi:glycosyltransferase involved in cell wall biosynthesis